MNNKKHKSLSLEEIHESVDTSQGKSKWRKIFSFLGPAYLVAIGYMDPGNWATDIEGGSRYGYQLIWVLVMSNIMAIILQSLCARLGIVYKKDLAQVNRETYPPIINYGLWILAEIAIAATDLAEIIGMAIGLNLLFGMPLIWGISITVFDTFLLLYLQKLGVRKMEAFILSLIVVILGSFVIQLFWLQPDVGEIAAGLKPSLPDDYALYVAIGIIGATVMPHNLYLHSALVQTRKVKDDFASKKKALKWNMIDSTIALNIAMVVNVSIIVLAGSAFYQNGYTEIDSIESAHKLLEPLVGNRLAPILFAIALIAAGQSSTVTGTLAGQIVMEGYLHIRINPWMRRLITRAIAVIPAFLTILWAGESKMTDLLILSQVILSVQLSFAIIPLIYAVANKKMMGAFVIKPWLLIISILIASVIMYLNLKMVYTEVVDFIKNSNSWWQQALVFIGVGLIIFLLLATILYPWIKNKRNHHARTIHDVHTHLQSIAVPQNKKIALALDFSKGDIQTLSYAMNQAQKESQFILIHVVESVGAHIHGAEVADNETSQDYKQLQTYKQFLQDKGFEAQTFLAYNQRAKAIREICEEQNADLLIMASHGHKGIFDFVYGQTIDAVRHHLKIPILIVNSKA